MHSSLSRGLGRLNNRKSDTVLELRGFSIGRQEGLQQCAMCTGGGNQLASSAPLEPPGVNQHSVVVCQVIAPGLTSTNNPQAQALDDDEDL
eukprot:3217885-Amphidinium_carterae.1